MSQSDLLFSSSDSVTNSLSIETNNKKCQFYNKKYYYIKFIVSILSLISISCILVTVIIEYLETSIDAKQTQFTDKLKENHDDGIFIQNSFPIEASGMGKAIILKQSEAMSTHSCVKNLPLPETWTISSRKWSYITRKDNNKIIKAFTRDRNQIHDVPSWHKGMEQHQQQNKPEQRFNFQGQKGIKYDVSSFNDTAADATAFMANGDNDHAYVSVNSNLKENVLSAHKNDNRIMKNISLALLEKKHMAVAGRAKRFLVYAQGTTLKFVFGASYPIEVMKPRSMSISYALHYQYQLPPRPYYWWDFFNSSSFAPRNLNLFGERFKPYFIKRDLGRIYIYKVMQSLMENFGLNGLSCLLMTICDISKNPFHTKDLGTGYSFISVVNKILNLVFIPSSHNIPPHYLDAVTAGRHRADCAATYHGCLIHSNTASPYDWLKRMTIYL